MISSPFLTLKGARSPVSRRRPSPTDRTLPRLGFSLAVSGRTMPDLVLDSASTRLTRILSPRGRSLAMIMDSFEIEPSTQHDRVIERLSHRVIGNPIAQWLDHSITQF